MPQRVVNGAAGLGAGQPGLPRRRSATRGWRTWALRLLLVILSPVAFFALLEAALRLAGYGYPTSVFLPTGQPGVYKTNHHFALRYFPPALARSPVASRVTSPKPAGTYRIFILGESAAQGTPRASISFARILQRMLQSRYPDTRFEVINAAVTAINSHVILDVARDCARRQPDLFVIYMGNNEVVGPFGPGTVFARFSPSRSAIRASLWFKTLRSGQLLSALLGGIGQTKDTPNRWTGMQMFAGNSIAADAPAMDTVYAHFEQNLRQIVQVAQSAGAQTVLCTVAVNLKDCAPFASLHKPDLGEAQRKRWDELYREANRLQEAGEHANAAVQYRRALDLDDRYAELHYRLAQSLLALEGGPQQQQEAVHHLDRARDLDALRFRADSRINRVIRGVAQSMARPDAGVHLADVERAFATISEARAAGASTTATSTTMSTTRPAPAHAAAAVPGAELFYEHVHFRFEGAYALAANVYQQVIPILPEWVQKQQKQRTQQTQLAANPQQPDALPSLRQCAASLGVTDLLLHRDAQTMADMLAGAPFTNQYDHALRLAAIRSEQKELARRLTPQALGRAAESLQEVIRQHPDDLWLHLHLGEIQYHRGLLDEALAEFTLASRELPEEIGWLPMAARAASKLRRFADAERFYRRFLQLEPANYDVRVDFAELLATQQKFDQALGVADEARPFVEPAIVPLLRAALRRAEGNMAAAEAEARRAAELAPAMPEAYLELGMALMARDPQAAAAQFRKALEQNPRSIEAHQRLAELALRQQKPAEAVAHCQAALAINPDTPDLNYTIGMTMLQQGAAAQAVHHFREELRIRPGSPAAQYYLAWLLACHPDPQIRNGNDAVVLAEQLVSARPGDPSALDVLAAAYAETGRFAEAAAHAEKAVRAARAAGALDLARHITQRWELYRTNQPYRYAMPAPVVPR